MIQEEFSSLLMYELKDRIRRYYAFCLFIKLSTLFITEADLSVAAYMCVRYFIKRRFYIRSKTIETKRKVEKRYISRIKEKVKGNKREAKRKIL